MTGLPPKSALHRALDPKGWDWDEKTEFGASAVEQLDRANNMYLRVHAKPGTKVPEPVRIGRPWDKE